MSLLFLKDVKWMDMYKMATLSGLLIGMVNGINRTYYNIPISKEEYEEEVPSGKEVPSPSTGTMSKLSKTKDYIQNATIDGVIVATYIAVMPISLPLYGFTVLYSLYND